MSLGGSGYLPDGTFLSGIHVLVGKSIEVLNGVVCVVLCVAMLRERTNVLLLVISQWLILTLIPSTVGGRIHFNIIAVLPSE